MRTEGAKRRVMREKDRWRKGRRRERVSRKEEEGKGHEEGEDKLRNIVRKARDRRKRNAVRKKE